MLAMAIIALPAENHFLFLPGFSILFVLFGAIALYVTLARFSHLLRILFHPVFLAGYAFLGFGFLIEGMPSVVLSRDDKNFPSTEALPETGDRVPSGQIHRCPPANSPRPRENSFA